MLFELADQNPCPTGAHPALVTTADGVILRTARWLPQGEPRGTLLLMQGRAEMIEKYFETIGEFLQRGFAVIAFDWRGQGGSQRLLADPMKGHISDFDDYQTDLEAVTQHYQSMLQKPVLILAHSMGSMILMRALTRKTDLARAVILTAPMFAIRLLRDQPWLGTLVKTLCRLGLQTRYPPLYRSQSPFTMAFADNPLSRDPRRFKRTQEILRASPALALGMPTLGWLKEALKAMNGLAHSLPDLKTKDLPPLLVFAGVKDRVTASAAARTVCAALDKATLIEIEHIEHELLMELDNARAQFWARVEETILPLFPA
jgi:lysophospholipase